MRTAIKHVFAVKLKSGALNSEMQWFLQRTAEMLPSIPGVKDFTLYRQTNRDTGFEYLISMEFENDEAYREYNAHPLHGAYVTDVWMKVAGELLVFDLKEMEIGT